MSRPELRFSIEKVTEENHLKWESYFTKEYRLQSDISNLCHRVYIMGDTDALRTFFLENYRGALESVFGQGVLEDQNKLQKAINFLKKMGANDRIGEFYDPILNAGMHNKLGTVPNGFHIASCHVNNDVVMSMLVVQSPDQQVQTHKFIFRSLGHLVKEAMEYLPPLRSLSLPLHDFAGKALGSHLVVTRPVHQMTEILRSQPEFKTFQNLDEEKRAIGEENWNYMRQYGIGDLRYPMTYREMSRPELAQAVSASVAGSSVAVPRDSNSPVLFRQAVAVVPDASAAAAASESQTQVDQVTGKKPDATPRQNSGLHQ